MNRCVLRNAGALVGLVACLWTAPAWAHVASDVATSGNVGGLATPELLDVGLPILAAGLLYAIGLIRLWQRSGQARAVRAARAASFAAGLVVLAFALLSRLERLGQELFAFHMIQHELLMLVAAPLLVCGQPLSVWLWAFPRGGRQWLSRLGETRAFAAFWRTVTSPLSAWTIHAIVLWVWHAPSLFDATLVDRGIHNLQHVTFLLSALLFWFALLSARAREAQGVAILYLFTTTVHTGALGALITFAARPWYAHYLATAPKWGLTALEDQQLGGLIMWVPASMVFVGFALVLLARWINAGPPEPVRTSQP